jgi:tryptophanyl-tRNA synthetase
MSKSYGNTVDIFLPDKELLKQIKAIKTDSTPLEEPKNPDTDTTFAIYQLIATPEQTAELRARYRGGNFGYGHAKQALFDLLVTKYKAEREAFDFYLSNPAALEEKLQAGEKRAASIAREVLGRVRKKLGFA